MNWSFDRRFTIFWSLGFVEKPYLSWKDEVKWKLNVTAETRIKISFIENVQILDYHQ